jgi:hypothetical protein
MTYPIKVTDNQWIVQVLKDGKTKELYIKFPEGSIDQVGWDIGDTLIWEELPTGGYSLRKDNDGRE